MHLVKKICDVFIEFLN